MPLLALKANCDVAYGMRIKRAVVLFGLFEPGRSEKIGQLHAYAQNLTRQLFGMPQPMLISGLCGNFPDCLNVSEGLVINLHLTGFLSSKDTARVEAGTIQVTSPKAYARVVGAHALGMRVLMEEMVRRVESEHKYLIIGNNVAMHGDFVYKWFLGSESRKPNLDLWDRYSPGLVAGQLVVGDQTDQTLHFEGVRSPGECAVLVTHFQKELVIPTPAHFLSAFETLHRMGKDGAVHGDIRCFNMLFLPRGRTVIIDYDFGGWVTKGAWERSNEANLSDAKWTAPRYPKGICLKLPDATRHEDVKEGSLILHDHDMFALASIMKFYSPHGEGCKEVWKEAQLAVESAQTTVEDLAQIIHQLPEREIDCSMEKLAKRSLQGTRKGPPKNAEANGP